MMKIINKLSIKTKFLIIFTLSSIIPILFLGISSYTSAVKSVEEQYTNSSIMLLNKISSNINLLIQQTEGLTTSISRNTVVMNALNQNSNERDYKPAVKDEILYLSKQINAPIQTILISKDGRYFGNYNYSKTEIEQVVKKIQDDDWYRNNDRYNYNLIFIGVKEDYIPASVNTYHFYFYRNLYNNERDYIGMVIVDINAYVIDRLLGSVTGRNNDIMYMLDENCSLLSVSNENRYVRNDELLKIKTLISGNTGVTKFNIDKTSEILTYVKLNHDNWTITHLVNEKSILKNVNGISVLTGGLIILLLIVEIFLYLMVSSNVTKPITRLSKEMHKVENGYLDITLKAKTDDEIGMLTNGFNKMIAEIKNLIEKIMFKEKTAKELEFAMLQAQINPHFLYNTLNCIKQIAEFTDSNSISSAISSLIKLLRYSISNRQDIILLKNEIDYLKSYIDLNNLRYNNKFVLVNNISSEYMNQKVIKFILQPLVENAILHGLKTKIGIGTIILSAYEEKGDITIMVIDDGIGIPGNKLAKISSHKLSNPDNSSGFNHIGIRSVDERLKLTYGNEYGLKIESEVGKGTVISVIMPLDTSIMEDKIHENNDC